MKKLIINFLIILLIFEFLNFKTLNSEDKLEISFYLKKGEEIKLIDLGKGKFKNFTYNFIKKEGSFELRLKGTGDLEFKIDFEKHKKIFPYLNDVFLSPIYIFENENKYLMFSIDYSDLHYFEFINNDNENCIIYNLYLKKKDNLKFRIDEVKSLSDAFNKYYEIYKIRERKTKIGGLIIPNISLTTIINSVGIGSLDIKYRIIDPKELYAPDRILEGSKYKMTNFVVFDPVKVTFENIDKENLIKSLYFDENIFNKLIGIEIISSSIKDKDGNIVSITKKSEPTYKIVSGEKVPDLKEGYLDTTIFLNPDPNYLKNKGINPFDIYFSRFIYPLNIAITKINNELEIKGENEAKYSGLALDFSNVENFFNFDKKLFTKNPLSFIDGKIAQFYASNLYELIKYLKDKILVLSINPKYFQLIMNSDLIYKEVDDLNYLKNLPIERVLVPNRPIFFSFRLKDSELNEENLNKIFKYSLLYGIYPTFWKSKDEPFSIWDNPTKLKLLVNYKDYYGIINEIEKESFKGDLNAKIENGEIYQFGDYPNIFFTINGYGKIYIDKNIINEEDFIIIDPIKKEELPYIEEDGKIVIDSYGLSVINIKPEEENKETSQNINFINTTRFENKNINKLLLIIPIFLILFNIFLRKTKILLKLNSTFLFLILFIILLILNNYFNISSPYLLIFSLGLFFLLSSLYSTSFKKTFLLNISLIFTIISILFYLLNG
ncbi:MAG: hypothetical protein H5U37_05530, partial [Caldisericia bacterium]|nr:hypothetical protein [Caldisericia bacterium]